MPRPSDGAALSAGLVRFLWRLAGPGSAAAVAREITACLASEPLRPAAVGSLLRLGAHRPELSAAVVEPLCRLVRDSGGGGSSGGRSGEDGRTVPLSGAAVVAGALTAADLARLPAAARCRLLSVLLSTELTALPAPALCRLLAAVGRWGAALPTAAAQLRRLAHCSSGTAASHSCSQTDGLDYSSVGGGGGGGALSEPAVRLALLESAARLFVRRPAELQLTLGLLLEQSAAGGGELAAAAARLYAALEVTGGTHLMDGTEDGEDGTEDSEDGAGDRTEDRTEDRGNTS